MVVQNSVYIMSNCTGNNNSKGAKGQWCMEKHSITINLSPLTLYDIEIDRIIQINILQYIPNILILSSK